jgi:hypothetical protein
MHLTKLCTGFPSVGKSTLLTTLTGTYAYFVTWFIIVRRMTIGLEMLALIKEDVLMLFFYACTVCRYKVGNVGNRIYNVDMVRVAPQGSSLDGLDAQRSPTFLLSHIYTRALTLVFLVQ